MKRPRRSKKVAQKKVVHKPRTPRRFNAPDPFHIDPTKVPIGWAYQWVGFPPSNSGWRPVPYSRHAHDFPKEACADNGFILIKGLYLCEIPAEYVRKELIDLEQKARGLEKDFNARLQREEGKGFYIMPPNWVAEEEIPPGAEQNEGPSVEIVVALPMLVPVRWRSAALYLKLDLEEYVRRRILMERPVLGTTAEFFEPGGVFYEPVKLSFTPTKDL